MKPPVRILLIGIALSQGVWTARADRSAAGLLRLVPADAAAVVVIEDAETHYQRLIGSRLWRDLMALPAVRQWRDSDRFRDLLRARGEIEAALDLPSLEAAWPKLLGDAVALAIRPDPGGDPDHPQGLLLLRSRDPALVARLLDRLNALESDQGLLAVESPTHRGKGFSIRRFRPGTKPNEAYVLFDDGVFAWANSDEFIRAVIDHQIDGGGLSTRDRFQNAWAELPNPAVVSGYIDARFLEGQLKLGKLKDQQAPVESLIRRMIGAADAVGMALAWKEGRIELHLHEVFDATRIDEPLRRWAARPMTGDPGTWLADLPESTLAVAFGPLDGLAFVDLLIGLVPRSERARIDAAMTLASGLLLGLDPRTEVLPNLGPQLLASVSWPSESPRATPRFTLALGLGGPADQVERLRGATANALRSILAVAALDRGDAAAEKAFVPLDPNGVSSAVLRGGPVPVAYAVGPSRLVLGNDPTAVLAFANAGVKEPAQSNRFDQFRRMCFPDAACFAFADLDRIGAFARARLERKGAASSPDLDHAVRLLGLFRHAFLTLRVAPDFSAAHQVLGLIEHEDDSR